MCKIWKDEGFLSLYNGTLARALYMIPHLAISMAFLEYMRPLV